MSPSRTADRRSFLESSLAAVAAGGILASRLSAQETSALMSAHAQNLLPNSRPSLRMSIAHWCFELAGDHWPLEKTCAVAQQLGCPSVELILPEHWRVLKKYGLVCAMTPNGMPDPPFQKGFNNPRHLDELVHRTKQTIDLCADAGAPNVIAFNGFKWIDPRDPTSGEIDRVEGADQCVRGMKQVVGHAEAKGVTICVEILNTRDQSHPMKGHPGYQGDDLDYIADIIRRVGSPRLKVLFDAYHVQVMNGDIMRRIEETKDIIGHVHVAGNPGRGELDATQEINYPAVIQKLHEVGYEGYVGIEFLPTRDPLIGLREAIAQCSA